VATSSAAPEPAFEIADATPEDAEALLAVKDASWREAYAHLLPGTPVYEIRMVRVAGGGA
jgi:hypothetical protein